MELKQLKRRIQRAHYDIRRNVREIINFPEYEVWLCPHCYHPDWFGFKMVSEQKDGHYLQDVFQCQWCKKGFFRLDMKRDNLIERFKRWIKHTPLDGRFSKNFNTYPYKKY